MHNSIVPSFLHELCFKKWNYEEKETKYQPVHEGRGLQKCLILNYSQNGRPDRLPVMLGLAESTPWLEKG